MIQEKIKEDLEYSLFIDKYLNDESVKKLENIPHHNSNRLDHSLKVSYYSYMACKKLGLNYESAAKAGLLHDMYYNKIDECNVFGDKFKVFAKHPEDALSNAEENFNLTPLEKDIIVSHMWPTSNHIPKYKESYVVSMVDKMSSFNEFRMKASFRLVNNIGVVFLFVIMSVFK